MTPTTTAEARNAWRAEAEAKITVEPESTGAAVRADGMLVARFAALGALMTQSSALAHAEALAGELRLGYVALAAGEPDRSIGSPNEVLFVDTDNRRMTLDMVVRQSAAIHPDWTIETHVGFLLNEHDRIAAPSMVEAISAAHGLELQHGGQGHSWAPAGDLGRDEHEHITGMAECNNCGRITSNPQAVTEDCPA